MFSLHNNLLLQYEHVFPLVIWFKLWINVCLQSGQINQYFLCEFLKISNGDSIFLSDQFFEYSTDAIDLSIHIEQFLISSHIFLFAQ